MKKFQRLLSAALALVLMIGIWHPAEAVEADSVSLSMTASDSSVQTGERVDVTVTADKDFTSLGSGMTICYDAKKLEPDVEASATQNPFRIEGPLNVGGKTALRISFLPGTQAEFSSDEPLAVLSFKTLAAGETAVTIGAAYLYDEHLREIPMQKSETVVLTVEPNAEDTPDAGYTLRMPGDIGAEVGSIVSIPVTIGNEDGKTGYNAFDIDFTYDPKVLELVSTQIPGMTVTASRGEINVIGYGEERKIDSVAFTLEFKVLKLQHRGENHRSTGG